MTSQQRREKMIELLSEAKMPVSAGVLAKELKVSRQVIVSDIALLRATGAAITSTHRGYILDQINDDGQIVRTIVCNHCFEDTLKELYIIVDHGGSIVNVSVSHPIYGHLNGELNITSRYDADMFFAQTNGQSASLLSSLTNGVHMHNICCKDEATFARITNALGLADILVQKAAMGIDM